MSRAESPIKILENPIPVSFRRMTLDDLECVLQLDHASFTLPWPESSFRFEISKNECSRCWVAEIRDENSAPLIVGMIVLWLIIDEIHVATFAVDPNYRRMGIARRLLASSLLEAIHSGGTKSFLEVRAGNLAARTLYSKFGYVEVGVRKKYYQDNGEDAILMNLEDIEIPLLESFL
jgi:[ribosomal protein S18]-alanine N-acetyltransferase